MSIVQDRSRRAHIDGDTQSQLFRPHLQGTKSCCLLGKTHRGDHSRCPAGTLLIHFPMPFEQLLLEILLVMEASHFEEGRLYEAHKVLHGPFFLRPMRPTQLHPDAHLEHRVGEDWIPFRYLAVSLPLQSHGLRRSNTHSRGTPPQRSRCSARLRTKLSTVSSFTRLTRMNREYFRREAKKWIRRVVPSINSTSTCPKSCWLNSPGRPSKRTRGFTPFGRSEATRAYRAVLPPG